MFYAEMLADAKDTVADMADLAQTWTTPGGGATWQVMMDVPTIGQELEAGGFKETVSHNVMLVASAASWTTPDGKSNSASIAAGSVISALGIGQRLVATSMGNRVYRIVDSSYMPGTAWVTLRVRNDNEY
jgi:hypothetical protein